MTGAGARLTLWPQLGEDEGRAEEALLKLLLWRSLVALLIF